MPARPATRCSSCRLAFTDRPGKPCRTCRQSEDRRIKRRSEHRWVYRDPRWFALREQVLVEEPLCACGCTGASTVVDHVRDHGGDPALAFDRDNCQGMTKPCHDAKTAGEHRALTGTPRPVTVVAGPPCAGKTTYVQAQAAPGDLVVDYDALAAALGSPDSHAHPEALKAFAAEARAAVLARLRRPSEIGRAWVTTTSHTPEALLAGADVVLLQASPAQCHARARAAARPAHWHTLIDEWFVVAHTREDRSA